MIRAQYRRYHELAVMEETGIDLNDPAQVERIKELSKTDRGATNIGKLLEHARSQVDGPMLEKIAELSNKLAISEMKKSEAVAA